MKRLHTAAIASVARVTTAATAGPSPLPAAVGAISRIGGASSELLSPAVSALSAVSQQRRGLMIRVEGTADPIRFPLGYISLGGNESVETVYEMVKDGHFVVADRTLESAHLALKGVAGMLDKEHIVNTIDDALFLQNKKREMLSRVLIRRDFWSYDDFNDPRMNTSYGIQNIYFDNYQWSQHLWPQFQTFVEKWYPADEHSHLTYREYLSLIMYFAAAVKGVMMRPLLPPNHRIKPPFGVPFPTRANRETIKLYMTWLHCFRAPLMLNKALVVRGGCGVVGLATRLRGVPMVRVCDPSPIAMEAARADAQRFGYHYKDMSFMTAEMFPPMPTKMELAGIKEDLSNPANTSHGNLHAVTKAITKHSNYNLITFHADMPILRGLTDGDPDYHFAPGLQGYSRHLEQFFEEADRYLDKHGVIAIVCTNLYNLAYPDRPNPIEYEIKMNRRWVLMDYYDRPMRSYDTTAAFDQWSSADLIVEDRSLRSLRCFKNKLRSELWILHKVDSLEEFGWIHGVPGAKAPSHVAKHWKRKTMRQQRLSMMRQQVELAGQDWGEYKSRMLRVLQENAGEGADREDMEAEGEPEDEEAAQIRMAMDPTYPMVLARRARRSMARKEAAREEFHNRVFEGFIGGGEEDGEGMNDDRAPTHSASASQSQSLSPREDYDRWAADVAAALRAKRAGIDDASSLPSAASPSVIGGSQGAVPFLSETPYATEMASERSEQQRAATTAAIRYRQQMEEQRAAALDDDDDVDGYADNSVRGGRSL